MRIPLVVVCSVLLALGLGAIGASLESSRCANRSTGVHATAVSFVSARHYHAAFVGTQGAFVNAKGKPFPLLVTMLSCKRGLTRVMR